ncbi:transposase, partial [Rhodoferax sp.]|uniref:transposase n=1 Tax=Rhodoferax sp. TaxID=50421 RepID=UPI0019EF52D8
ERCSNALNILDRFHIVAKMNEALNDVRSSEARKLVAKTLRSHRELILNYFRAKKQFSSGVVEGLNNKVKVTMRKSYGFRTFRITELALYHVLGKLPEPQLAHRFY